MKDKHQEIFKLHIRNASRELHKAMRVISEIEASSTTKRKMLRKVRPLFDHVSNLKVSFPEKIVEAPKKEKKKEKKTEVKDVRRR